MTVAPGDRPPLLLALDTATATASMALHDGRRVLGETTWLAGREHSAQLLLEVERALARSGRSTADLTGLAVARGPGSFTGVRVGLAVAKGLAAGLRLPLWGVSSLAGLAHGVADLADEARVVLEVGRGRLATALFRGREPAESATLVTVAELIQRVEPGQVVAGELPADAAAALRAAGARVIGPAASLRRASLLAEVAWVMALAGDPGDPATVDAVYLAR